jgi:heterodisulfide reductase subunit A-like polyferredoxin
MQAHRGGTPMLAASGYLCQVDAQLCAGCGDCAQYCQFGALALDDGVTVVNVSTCMGCGVCVAHCAHDALTLVRDPAKGVPLEIEELLATAASYPDL